MDYVTLVEDRIGDGRRFLKQFVADGNSVLGAFWVRTAEEGLWFLYVVTASYDDVGPAAAYRAVHASLRKLGDAGASGFDIKVVGSRNPIARDALTMLPGTRSRLNTKEDGYTLGSLRVEQSIVYPAELFTVAQPKTMTSEAVGLEVLRLLNRGPGTWPSSRIALTDGTSFDGVPFALQLGSQQALVVQFIADGEAAPRIVRLDEIAAIS